MTAVTPASSRPAAWARVEQPLRNTSCRLRRWPEERRQPLGVRHGTLRAGRLEEQPVAAGVAAVMEDRHPVAMLGEDLEDLVERGIGPDDQLAQPFPLGAFEDGLELPQLLRQVAEIAFPLLLVGEGQQDHRLIHAT